MLFAHHGAGTLRGGMNADCQCAKSPAGGCRLVHGSTPLSKADMSFITGYIAIRHMRIRGAPACCRMRSQGCSCFDWDFGRFCLSRLSRPSLSMKGVPAGSGHLAHALDVAPGKGEVRSCRHGWVHGEPEEHHDPDTPWRSISMTCMKDIAGASMSAVETRRPAKRFGSKITRNHVRSRMLRFEV